MAKPTPPPQRLKNPPGLKPVPAGASVLLFQPTHYKHVTSKQELKEWERQMVELVGIDPSILNIDSNDPSAFESLTFSASGGIQGNQDDCDEAESS